MTVTHIYKGMTFKKMSPEFQKQAIITEQFLCCMEMTLSELIKINNS